MKREYSILEQSALAVFLCVCIFVFYLRKQHELEWMLVHQIQSNSTNMKKKDILFYFFD